MGQAKNRGSLKQRREEAIEINKAREAAYVPVRRPSSLNSRLMNMLGMALAAAGTMPSFSDRSLRDRAPRGSK